VHRGHHDKFILDLRVIELEIVANQLLPAVFEVKENVFASFLLILRVNYWGHSLLFPRLFDLFEPRFKLFDKLPALFLQF